MNKTKSILYSILICLFVVFNTTETKAQNNTIQAFDADTNYAIFANDESTIHVYDTKKSIEILNKKLTEDNALMDSILKSILQINNIKNDSFNSRIRERIKQLSIVNVTILNDKFLVGITFTTDFLKNYPINNIILQFDSKLNHFKHYVLFSKNKSIFYTFIPFYPLNFIQNNTFLQPICSDKGFELRAFKFSSEKSHKAILQDSVYTKLKSTITPKLDVQYHTIIEPLLIPVGNSQYKYYYEFPFPLFYTSLKSHYIFSDGYNTQKFIDSCQKNKDHKQFGVYSKNLNFNNTINRYDHIVLTSELRTDRIISINYDKGNTHIEIQNNLFYEPVIMSSLVEIHPTNTYFKISGNYLIYLVQVGTTYTIHRTKL